MSEWQPIETAPKNRLILAWMEGYERHGDMEWKWRRSGFALMAIHYDGPAKHLLDAAIKRIVSPDPDMVSDIELAPSHWMPLPDPPNHEQAT